LRERIDVFQGEGAGLSMAAGAVIMGWIVGEAYLLRQISSMEVFYFAVGLAMAMLGFGARDALAKE
jgi:hypothetical protein